MILFERGMRCVLMEIYVRSDGVFRNHIRIVSIVASTKVDMSLDLLLRGFSYYSEFLQLHRR